MSSSSSRPEICVALLHGTAEQEQRLRTRIADRPWKVVIHDEPARAMAELCLRDAAAAIEDGDGVAGGTVMVVAETQRWSQWPQLLAAIERYLPRVTIYGFDDHDLQLVRDGTTPSAGTGPPAAAWPTAAVGPEPNGSVSGRDDVGTETPTITRQEIEMLLGATRGEV